MVLAYVVLAWLGYRGADQVDQVWVNSFVQFQFFAAGTLIAIGLHKRRWTVGWVARAALVCFGLAVIYGSELLFHLLLERPATLRTALPGHAMLLIGSVTLFLAFVEAPLRPPAWLTYLGKISYGLYVFHGFVIGLELFMLGWFERHGRPISVVVPHIVALAITIGLATISYQYFERPILRFKQRFSYVKRGDGTADA